MTIKLIIFTLSILHIDALHEQCFADVDFPYVYFSARTSYAASGKSQINTPESKLIITDKFIVTCLQYTNIGTHL